MDWRREASDGSACCSVRSQKIALNSGYEFITSAFQSSFEGCQPGSKENVPYQVRGHWMPAQSVKSVDATRHAGVSFRQHLLADVPCWMCHTTRRIAA